MFTLMHNSWSRLFNPFPVITCGFRHIYVYHFFLGILTTQSQLKALFLFIVSNHTLLANRSCFYIISPAHWDSHMHRCPFLAHDFVKLENWLTSEMGINYGSNGK